jgi:uncharacterized membrane protein
MNVRPMLVVNGLLVAAMAAVSAWGWQSIPDGMQIPMNIGLDGNAYRHTDKEQYLLLMPAIALGLTIFLAILPFFDPRRANLAASSKFWNAAGMLSVGLLAYVHVLLVWAAAGNTLDLTSALIPGLSLLFIGIGNYLGKTRSNWFGGVRTPWSLSSEYSWEQTHRWSGRMMVLSGVISLVAWFFLETKIALLLLTTLVIGSSLLSIALSYIFWRADPDRQANGH